MCFRNPEPREQSPHPSRWPPGQRCHSPVARFLRSRKRERLSAPRTAELLLAACARQQRRIVDATGRTLAGCRRIEDVTIDTAIRSGGGSVTPCMPGILGPQHFGATVRAGRGAPDGVFHIVGLLRLSASRQRHPGCSHGDPAPAQVWALSNQ